jgi:aminopeptidase
MPSNNAPKNPNIKDFLMTPEQFELNLQKYANLMIRVGVNVQKGQRLLIFSTFTQDPAIRRLVHYAVASAYDAGARLVEVFWRDEELQRIRVEHAADETFDEIAPWTLRARHEVTEEGGCVLVLLGDNPKALEGLDQTKLARMNKVRGELARPIFRLSDQGYGSWSLGAIATQPWADVMLPDFPAEERVMRLWEYIFETCRVFADDPVAAWKTHADDLQARGKYLTAKQYVALKYSAPGTDLTVGLPPKHIWVGGGEKNNKAVHYMPNIPTEEVFTMPHRNKVNGTVRASKPLSYNGSLIEGFGMSFKDGKVVEFSAEKNEDVLRTLLTMDESASYLGEVALAPNSSPISKTGRLFFETLFDENAANHLALGSAYAINIEGGPAMNEDEFVEMGGNDSLVHEDFMIGSGEMNVDGITIDGKVEPIMRNGEWAFSY